MNYLLIEEKAWLQTQADAKREIMRDCSGTRK